MDWSDEENDFEIGPHTNHALIALRTAGNSEVVAPVLPAPLSIGHVPDRQPDALEPGAAEEADNGTRILEAEEDRRRPPEPDRPWRENGEPIRPITPQPGDPFVDHEAFDREPVRPIAPPPGHVAALVYVPYRPVEVSAESPEPEGAERHGPVAAGAAPPDDPGDSGSEYGSNAGSWRTESDPTSPPLRRLPEILEHPPTFAPAGPRVLGPLPLPLGEPGEAETLADLARTIAHQNALYNLHLTNATNHLRLLATVMGQIDGRVNEVLQEFAGPSARTFGNRLIHKLGTMDNEIAQVNVGIRQLINASHFGLQLMSQTWWGKLWFYSVPRRAALRRTLVDWTSRLVLTVIYVFVWFWVLGALILSWVRQRLAWASRHRLPLGITAIAIAILAVWYFDGVNYGQDAVNWTRDYVATNGITSLPKAAIYWLGNTTWNLVAWILLSLWSIPIWIWQTVKANRFWGQKGAPIESLDLQGLRPSSHAPGNQQTSVSGQTMTPREEAEFEKNSYLDYVQRELGGFDEFVRKQRESQI